MYDIVKNKKASAMTDLNYSSQHLNYFYEVKIIVSGESR